MNFYVLCRTALKVMYAAMASILVMPSVAAAQQLAITNVQPDRAQFDPSMEAVTIRFVTTAPAKIQLDLYDGRELLVRRIRSDKLLPSGEHALQWNGRDEAGKTVPPEAYTYVLEGKTESGTTVRYDLADQTGAQDVVPRDVKWDAATGLISYVLDRPSRVNIRLGLHDGALLRTLLDWVVRPAGLQQEKWDGKDASGTLDLSKHPRLALGAQAFSLPENTLIVGQPQGAVQLIKAMSWERVERPRTRLGTKRMYAHGQQPMETRGDFKVHLQLPASTKLKNGLPVITGMVPVRLDVDPADRQRALSRRFEPVFFVDGQFVFENEVGFVPMTWNFDPGSLNEGEHYLSVNLRGYEGNFGIATVKVWVAKSGTSTSKPDKGSL